jgi:hypothetical protein
MQAEKNTVALAVRVPRETAEWLKREAEENHRSVSGQVAYLVEQKRKEALNSATLKE